MAAYDTFDYPSYWTNRDYEHNSEVFAIQEFLKRIENVKTAIEIGAGFGRLTPSYSFRAKKTILVDPSSKLLKIAKKNSDSKNTKFIKSRGENLKDKVKTNSIDLAILVRVLHHIKDPERVFSEINRILNKRGYFILEFANKCHFKSRISEFMKGNFTYSLDISKRDIRSEKSIKKKTIPFNNYHPDKIYNLLKESGFEIVDVRSVSNIRSSFLKRIFSTDTLTEIEKLIQRPLAKVTFGPSMFVLTRKK